jgi:hypothetical protein
MADAEVSLENLNAPLTKMNGFARICRFAGVWARWQDAADWKNLPYSLFPIACSLPTREAAHEAL